MPKRIHQRIDGEATVPAGREITLTIREGEDGTPVPSVLQLPDEDSPVPAALLVHGFSSVKEVMARSIGRALLLRGIASLAVDLPLHGERSDGDLFKRGANPLELLRELRTAVDEGAMALGYLAAHPATDATRMATVGFSLGSWIAMRVGAGHSGVRAVVVAGGGDLPDTSFGTLVRPFVDPLAAVRALNGRALLMVHGRRDRTIPPAQAQRLFDAAGEPKSIEWYEAGHYLPEAAIDRAASWVAEQLTARRP